MGAASVMQLGVLRHTQWHTRVPTASKPTVVRPGRRLVSCMVDGRSEVLREVPVVVEKNHRQLGRVRDDSDRDCDWPRSPAHPAVASCDGFPPQTVGWATSAPSASWVALAWQRAKGQLFGSPSSSGEKVIYWCKGKRSRAWTSTASANASAPWSFGWKQSSVSSGSARVCTQDPFGSGRARPHNPNAPSLPWKSL